MDMLQVSENCSTDSSEPESSAAVIVENETLAIRSMPEPEPFNEEEYLEDVKAYFDYIEKDGITEKEGIILLIPSEWETASEEQEEESSIETKSDSEETQQGQDQRQEAGPSAGAGPSRSMEDRVNRPLSDNIAAKPARYVDVGKKKDIGVHHRVARVLYNLTGGSRGVVKVSNLIAVHNAKNSTKQREGYIIREALRRLNGSMFHFDKEADTAGLTDQIINNFRQAAGLDPLK